MKEYLGYLTKQWDTWFGRRRHHPYATYGETDDGEEDADGDAGEGAGG